LVRWNWLFGNGDVSGWQGKRNRPCWKTSTEWQRRETVANHAAGLPTPSGRGPAPSAPTRSLGINQCGSSEKRENNRIHRGPRDRNGSLGANVVGERHALPRSCTTFSGGRAFTLPDFPEYAPAVSSGVPGTLQRIVISETGWCPRVIEERRSAEISAQLNRSQQRTSDK
jgi:hypothetical protein